MTNLANLLAKRHRQQLLDMFGNKCQELTCRAHTHLQFAHVLPTKLRGRGRGRKERLTDIRKHPESYTLFCDKHHKLYDGGVSLQFKQRPEITIKYKRKIRASSYPKGVMYV